jgi:hypothetical protein
VWIHYFFFGGEMATATGADAVEVVSDGTIRMMVTQGNTNELRRLLTNPANVKLINVKGRIVSAPLMCQ